MRQERLKEIDILRAIAFIFVVVQHTLGGYSNIKGIPYASFTIMKLMYVMAKTAVPIFLFISAIALFYVYSKRFNYKSYYFKRIKYVFIPYIIWSAINMIKLGNKDRFKDFVIQLIAGNGAFHLWYMGMVLRVFLIFPIILWIAKKIHLMNIKFRVSIFMLLVCLYYPISKYHSIISDNIGKFIFGTPTDTQQKIIYISILFWYLFFVLGIYFALNYEFIKKKLIKYRVTIFVSYCLSFAYVYLREIENDKSVSPISILYMVLSILVFYLVAVSLAEKNKVYKLMKFIGDYSFAAYMAHVIVINYVANKIMIELNTKNYLIVGILTLIITSAVTPALIKLISYLPYSEYVTGTKRSRIKGIFFMNLWKYNY
jgi:probable poly-beta-1,6-N-acetyl-D-glucosamine export protein